MEEENVGTQGKQRKAVCLTFTRGVIRDGRHRRARRRTQNIGQGIQQIAYRLVETLTDAMYGEFGNFQPGSLPPINDDNLPLFYSRGFSEGAPSAINEMYEQQKKKKSPYATPMLPPCCCCAV